jgi:DNA-binding transcriptional LysR family regulator
MKDRLSSRPRTLSPARLRALMQVAEAGSYAAAARALGLSHAAVAQQIRAFEAEEGIRLFERVEGGLRPTPIARELCEIGERLREAEREIERVLARRDSAGNLRLRVGLGNAMPGIALIGEVIARHRALSVSVVSGSHQEILAAVLKREVEVGILPDVPADPRFRRAPLLRQEVVAIAAPGHPLAAAEVLSLDQLARHPMVFRSRGSSTQRVVDRAFRRAGLSPEPVLIADTRDAVYEAVAVGIGVGFMWRHGTFRSDLVRRIAVPEFRSDSEETVFALADERNAVVDLFFHAADSWRRR